jgi:hypothetical protein
MGNKVAQTPSQGYPHTGSSSDRQVFLLTNPSNQMLPYTCRSEREEAGTIPWCSYPNALAVRFATPIVSSLPCRTELNLATRLLARKVSTMTPVHLAITNGHHVRSLYRFVILSPRNVSVRTRCSSAAQKLTEEIVHWRRGKKYSVLVKNIYTARLPAEVESWIAPAFDHSVLH